MRHEIANTFAKTLDEDDQLEVEEAIEERFQNERKAPTFDLPQHIDELIAALKFARFPRTKTRTGTNLAVTSKTSQSSNFL